MTTKPFDDLRKDMSPERKARNKATAEAILDKMPTEDKGEDHPMVPKSAVEEPQP